MASLVSFYVAVKLKLNMWVCIQGRGLLSSVQMFQDIN